MSTFLLCLGQYSIELGNCYVLQLGYVMYLLSCCSRLGTIIPVESIAMVL